MSVATYSVPDISCQGCANAIKRAVGSATGISNVDVDVAAKRVTVDYDESKIQPSAIREHIEDAGYEAQQV